MPVSRVSVVLPTYQESGSICALIAAVGHALERAGCASDIVVADDASPDGTADLVRATYAADPSVRVLERRGQRGLAASILDGIRAARGDWVVVMDADFNHDPDDLPRLIARARDLPGERAIVSGSRFLAGGGMYSAGRQLGSRAMSALARRMLRVEATDLFAGFFVAHRARLEELPLDAIFRGYGDYYLRLVSALGAHGFEIVELPVVYPPRRAGRSKTPLARTTLRYAREIVRAGLARV